MTGLQTEVAEIAEKRTQKVAIATHIMTSAISHECLLLLINKKWADSHFGAVYVSCIS